MALRVDFYVSEVAGAEARLRLACRVAEKAYLANQKVIVYFDDPTLLPKFDELLWTFGDGSFVPHDAVAPDGTCASPVALTAGPMPAGHTDVLINLGNSVPERFDTFTRVAEFLDKYPALWPELSYRNGITQSGGALSPDWRDLFARYSDRFLLGSDTWINERWASYDQTMAEYRAWLKQLPKAQAERIAFGNAERLFGPRKAE